MVLPSFQLSDKQLPPNISLIIVVANKSKSHRMLTDPVGWIAVNLLFWRKHVPFVGNNITGIKEIINAHEMSVTQ